MDAPESFEHSGSRGFYRPAGIVSYDQALQMFADAIQFARDLKLTDLLVNSQGLGGFASPDVVARYALAVKWAQSAAGSLRVALVVRPEFMDPQKIAMLMANNRGVVGDVFTDEVDALAWLDSRTGGPGAV
jgi:hypothetical protein